MFAPESQMNIMNTIEKIPAFEVELKLRLLIINEDYSARPNITRSNGDHVIDLGDYNLNFKHTLAQIEGDRITDIRVELTELVDDECSDQSHILEHSQVLNFLIEAYITQAGGKWMEKELDELKNRIKLANQKRSA